MVSGRRRSNAATQVDVAHAVLLRRQHSRQSVISAYAAANAISVNNVDVRSPPTITIASGRSISVPCRRKNRNGINPRMAVEAVISFGRTRPRLASRTAS